MSSSPHDMQVTAKVNNGQVKLQQLITLLQSNNSSEELLQARNKLKFLLKNSFIYQDVTLYAETLHALINWIQKAFVAGQFNNILLLLRIDAKEANVLEQILKLGQVGALVEFILFAEELLPNFCQIAGMDCQIIPPFRKKVRLAIQEKLPYSLKDSSDWLQKQLQDFIPYHNVAEEDSLIDHMAKVIFWYELETNQLQASLDLLLAVARYIERVGVTAIAELATVFNNGPNVRLLLESLNEDNYRSLKPGFIVLVSQAIFTDYTTQVGFSTEVGKQQAMVRDRLLQEFNLQAPDFTALVNWAQDNDNWLGKAIAEELLKNELYISIATNDTVSFTEILTKLCAVNVFAFDLEQEKREYILKNLPANTPTLFDKVLMFLTLDFTDLHEMGITIAQFGKFLSQLLAQEQVKVTSFIKEASLLAYLTNNSDYYTEVINALVAKVKALKGDTLQLIEVIGVEPKDLVVLAVAQAQDSDLYKFVIDFVCEQVNIALRAFPYSHQYHRLPMVRAKADKEKQEAQEEIKQNLYKEFNCKDSKICLTSSTIYATVAEPYETLKVKMDAALSAKDCLLWHKLCRELACLLSRECSHELLNPGTKLEVITNIVVDAVKLLNNVQDKLAYGAELLAFLTYRFQDSSKGFCKYIIEAWQNNKKEGAIIALVNELNLQAVEINPQEVIAIKRHLLEALFKEFALEFKIKNINQLLEQLAAPLDDFNSIVQANKLSMQIVYNVHTMLLLALQENQQQKAAIESLLIAWPTFLRLMPTLLFKKLTNGNGLIAAVANTLIQANGKEHGLLLFAQVLAEFPYSKYADKVGLQAQTYGRFYRSMLHYQAGQPVTSLQAVEERLQKLAAHNNSWLDNNVNVQLVTVALEDALLNNEPQKLASLLIMVARFILQQELTDCYKVIFLLFPNSDRNNVLQHALNAKNLLLLLRWMLAEKDLWLLSCNIKATARDLMVKFKRAVMAAIAEQLGLSIAIAPDEVLAAIQLMVKDSSRDNISYARKMLYLAADDILLMNSQAEQEEMTAKFALLLQQIVPSLMSLENQHLLFAFLNCQQDFIVEEVDTGRGILANHARVNLSWVISCMRNNDIHGLANIVAKHLLDRFSHEVGTYNVKEYNAILLAAIRQAGFISHRFYLSSCWRYDQETIWEEVPQTIKSLANSGIAVGNYKKAIESVAISALVVKGFTPPSVEDSPYYHRVYHEILRAWHDNRLGHVWGVIEEDFSGSYGDSMSLVLKENVKAFNEEASTKTLYTNIVEQLLPNIGITKLAEEFTKFQNLLDNVVYDADLGRANELFFNKKPLALSVMLDGEYWWESGHACSVTLFHTKDSSYIIIGDRGGDSVVQGLTLYKVGNVNDLYGFVYRVVKAQKNQSPIFMREYPKILQDLQLEQLYYIKLKAQKTGNCGYASCAKLNYRSLLLIHVASLLSEATDLISVIPLAESATRQIYKSLSSFARTRELANYMAIFPQEKPNRVYLAQMYIKAFKKKFTLALQMLQQQELSRKDFKKALFNIEEFAQEYILGLSGLEGYRSFVAQDLLAFHAKQLMAAYYHGVDGKELEQILGYAVKELTDNVYPQIDKLMSEDNKIWHKVKKSVNEWLNKIAVERREMAAVDIFASSWEHYRANRPNVALPLPLPINR